LLAIKGGRIITVAGEEIKNGVILIDEGRITAAGNGISIPREAEVVDASSWFVMPGLIDAHTHVGIGEESIGFEGQDYNETSDPVTPHLRVIDGFYPSDEALKDALEGGVTTICAHPGSANVVGGQSLVVKTGPPSARCVDKLVVREPAGMKMACGENPKRVDNGQGKAPRTRMATAALLRKILTEARTYMEKKSGDDAPDTDLRLEAMELVLRKQIPLRAHAHRADDILTAVRIAREFDVDVVIEHCTEGHLIAGYLAELGIQAVVGPTLISRSKYELRERTFATPCRLFKAGVEFALMTDHPVIPVQYLPVAAGLAVKCGLPEAAAIRAMTLSPARILGIDDRLGSIQAGKDADIVIMDGTPLDLRSSVKMVFINGERVFTAAGCGDTSGASS